MRVAISHAVTRDVTLRNTPWNTVYLSRVVDQLRADGHDLTNEVLRHVSPQIWEHINPIGIYDWSGRSWAAKRNIPILDAPKGRRDEFVEPYFKGQNPTRSSSC